VCFQWKETAGNQLMDSKLRCVFVLEEGGAHPDSGTFDGGNEYTTAKTDLPVKASALSSSPKVKQIVWFCIECFFIDRKKFLPFVPHFTKLSNAPIDWFYQPERKDWTNHRVGSNGWPSIRNLDLCRIGKGFSKIGSS
jgi:hypothetical protein